MLYVTLSAAPNFDYDDNDPRARVRVAPKKVAVRDLQDAAKACQQFIRQNNLGGGNWTGGEVTDAHGKLVATVSYNGRVWGPDKKEIRLAYSYSYSRTAADTQMAPGKWYTQSNGLGTLWFRADELLKSGGYNGYIVEWYSRRPKAKKASVPPMARRLWKEVDLNDVPEEIKAAAGPLRTASAQMSPGKWYKQTFGAGDSIWFRADEVLKNGGVKGLTVEWRSRTPKAKKDSVPKAFWHLWKEVSESEVPDEIKDSARGKTAAESWYAPTAAKKPVAEKESGPVRTKKPSPVKKAEPDSARTDGTKKSEVEKAVEMIRGAIDAILDCAPNARDFHEDESYNSKAYAKAVAKHSETVDGLHDILGYLQALESTAKD